MAVRCADYECNGSSNAGVPAWTCAGPNAQLGRYLTCQLNESATAFTPPLFDVLPRRRPALLHEYPVGVGSRVVGRLWP